MNPSEHCATCHPEKMPDHKHTTHAHKTQKAWLSFDRMLPTLLGVLVIVSMVQTIELGNLKDSLAANAQSITSSGTLPETTVQPAAQPANPYQGLPAQVGGC